MPAPRLTLQDQLGLVATALLVVAAGTGTLEGTIYTAMWAIFSAAGLVCLYIAYPHVSERAALLLAAYFSIMGAVVVADLRVTDRWVKSSWLPLLAGGVLEALAAYFTYLFLTWVRAERSRAAYMAKMRWGRKVAAPLGLWSLGVVAFMVLSNISAFALAAWVRGALPLTPYMGTEAALILMAVALVRLPEVGVPWDALEEGALPAALSRPREEGAGTSSMSPGSGHSVPGEQGSRAAAVERSPGSIIQRLRLPESCPACGAALQFEGKRCPSCGEEERVGWCPASETVAVACPSCQRLAPAGGKCRKCGAAVPDTMKCGRCRKTHPLVAWG